MAGGQRSTKWRPVQILAAVAGLGGVAYFGLCREDIVDRTAMAVVASDNGDFVIFKLKRGGSNQSSGPNSTGHGGYSYRAYSLDGHALGTVESGTNLRVMGNAGDRVWFDMQGNASLADMRTGTWLVDGDTMTRTNRQLGKRWSYCQPDSLEFSGSVDRDSGALCVVGNNGLDYLLDVTGKLTPFPRDPEQQPRAHCPDPDRQWLVLGSGDCLALAPDPAGGYALVSTNGWRSKGMLAPHPVRGLQGYAERMGPRKLLLVRHKPQYDKGLLVSALDEHGAVVWTVSSSQADHYADGLVVAVTKKYLVIGSSRGRSARFTVHSLADGSRVHTISL